MLNICELFKSIQGESSRAGLVCSFVRLAGCNLRCTWCDTAYAWEDGEERTVESIIAEVKTHQTSLVEITGGEPLLQPETGQLCQRFIAEGFTVLVETNGSVDISLVPPPVVRILDVKTPSSGHRGSFLDKNFGVLDSRDEVKFVIADKTDFDWSLTIVKERSLDRKVANVIFSPVMNVLKPQDLAEWIITADAPVRLGVQLHKIVWGDRRGV